MPPEAIRQVQYGRVDSLVQTIGMILNQLDQYGEDEILETLMKIEEAIEQLPIDEFVKPRLYNILWAQNLSIQTSLRTVATLLNNSSYIN